jgi:hypothetical protein
MRLSMIGLVFLVNTLLSGRAMALPCATRGMDVLRANDGSGYIFYVYRDSVDFGFMLTGKTISFPEGFEGKKRFTIDGIVYEVVMLDPSIFMKNERNTSQSEMLKQYQEYTTDTIKKVGSPLTSITDLGSREKDGSNGKPGFIFHLFVAVKPLDPTGPREYFLSTISEGEVVVLSAIALTQAEDPSVTEAFELYAQTFKHIVDRQECPDGRKKDKD